MDIEQEMNAIIEATSSNPIWKQIFIAKEKVKITTDEQRRLMKELISEIKEVKLKFDKK